MNEKTTIEVFKRKLLVELDGLTQLEVHAIAKDVSEKMEEIQRNEKIADSSKLAILTALDFAADLERLREAHATAKHVAERKIEEITQLLKSSLAAPEK